MTFKKQKMITTLLGLKSEMQSKFNELGQIVPVTTIVAEPNIILKVGENKAQIGFGKTKRVKKPQNEYVKAAGFMPRYIKEVTFAVSQSENTKYNPGDKLDVSIFEPGDIVKVTGITKGRGFAGGIKRWGFHGGPKTHGQSDRHRAPGSIGQTTTPGRVFKGKKMAGHYGAEQITVIGLEVVDVNAKENRLFVKGSVPGSKNGLLILQKTGKVKKFVPLTGKTIREEKSPADKTQEVQKSKEPQEVQEQQTAKHQESNPKKATAPKNQIAPTEDNNQELIAENKEKKDADKA